MSPDNSLMVVCGGGVLVVAMCNVAATNDVAAAVGFAATEDVGVGVRAAVAFCVDGGDNNGKGAIMVLSANKPGPTFNNGEAGVFSTMVLIARMTLVCVVSPYG